MAAISSAKLYDLLIDRGIDELHHANSVATSCLFLRENSLLSRGTVERRGLKQTPQVSDGMDKRYSIWYDIFLDTVDIHSRARRFNEYGPVTFVIDTDLIDDTLTGKIWVTKENPTRWAGKRENQRWFQDVDELKEGFHKGTFGNMIVLRHCGGELPLSKFLKKIILDDPNLLTKKDVDYYSMGLGALRGAMAQSGIKVPIERRSCSRSCTCETNYGKDWKRTLRMFDPYYNEE
jgi:hypothetical protein